MDLSYSSWFADFLGAWVTGFGSCTGSGFLKMVRQEVSEVVRIVAVIRPLKKLLIFMS